MSFKKISAKAEFKKQLTSSLKAKGISTNDNLILKKLAESMGNAMDQQIFNIMISDLPLHRPKPIDKSRVPLPIYCFKEKVGILFVESYRLKFGSKGGKKIYVTWEGEIKHALQPGKTRPIKLRLKDGELIGMISYQDIKYLEKNEAFVGTDSRFVKNV